MKVIRQWKGFRKTLYNFAMKKRNHILATFAREQRILCAMRQQGLATLAKAFPNSIQTDGEPSNTAIQAEELLKTLNAYLDEHLAQAQIPQTNPRRKPVFRPDLRTFKPWLLRQIIGHYQEIDEAGRHGNIKQKPAYRLFEDIPKIIDDLWLFHRLVEQSRALQRKGETPILSRNERDLTLLDLESLNRLTAPHRPKYPLAPADRIQAHNRFVADYGGNGEAYLLGTLENGTEVIELRSEKAAIAYGSPRWCTSWLPPRENYFEDHKDHLWMVLSPDGDRWLLHIRSQQFNDSDDQNIGLDSVLKLHPGLSEVIAQQVPQLLKEAYLENDADRMADILCSCVGASRSIKKALRKSSPEFGKELCGQVSSLLNKEVDQRDVYNFVDLIGELSTVPEWIKSFPIKDFHKILILSASEENEHGNPINELCSAATDVKEWREFLTWPEGIPMAINISSKAKEMYNFVYLLEACEKIPEWQKAVPIEAIPIALSQATKAADLRVFPMILEICAKVPEWKEVVPISTIQNALKRKNTLTTYPHLGPNYSIDFVAGGKQMIAGVIAQVAEWNAPSNGDETSPMRGSNILRRDGSNEHPSNS